MHPVDLGLVDRVRAHRIGQHVELAARVVAADGDEAAVEGGGVWALEEEPRVDRPAPIGLALAGPADRPAGEERQAVALSERVRHAAGLLRSMRRPRGHQRA